MTWCSTCTSTYAIKKCINIEAVAQRPNVHRITRSLHKTHRVELSEAY